ncbi:unnamed protein product, partial [Didymodactylos carnosus]
YTDTGAYPLGTPKVKQALRRVQRITRFFDQEIHLSQTGNN